MQDQSLYSQMNINPTFPEQEHLNCPRCDSPNTKFCYYNNYNLSQPRHFCKNCKRYWTKGGALRNIPIGGCSRKHSKRSSTTKHHPSSTTPSSSVTAMATGSLSSPKAAVNEDHRLFNAILEPVKEGHSGNLDHGLSPDRPNLSLGEFVNSNSGLGSGSGSGMVRNDDQEEGHASKVGKNNSSTSSCWKSGSNWTDLSIFTPSSSLK